MKETDMPIVEADLMFPKNLDKISEKEQLQQIIDLRDRIVENVIKQGRLNEYLDDLSNFTNKLEERDNKLNDKKSNYRNYKVFHILANSSLNNANSPLFDLEGEFSIVNFFNKLNEKYITSSEIGLKYTKNNEKKIN